MFKMYEDKGTPVKIEFTLSNGEIIPIEPFQIGASGLVIKSEIADNFLDIPVKLPPDINPYAFNLINDTGKVLGIIPIPKGATIQRIVSFVVYPNGTSWAGEILEGDKTNIGAMLWSKDAAKKLFKDSENKTIFDNPDWQKVPTIVTINPRAVGGSCFRIEHTCPSCDYMSKLL